MRLPAAHHPSTESRFDFVSSSGKKKPHQKTNKRGATICKRKGSTNLETTSGFSVFFFSVLGLLQIRLWEIKEVSKALLEVAVFIFFYCCCGFAEIWSFGIRSWQFLLLLQVWLIFDFDHQVCTFRVSKRKGSTNLETASGFSVFFLVLGLLQIRPWEIKEVSKALLEVAIFIFFCCCCGFAEIWSFGIRSWQLLLLLQVWLISDFDHQVCKFRVISYYQVFVLLPSVRVVFLFSFYEFF